MKTKAKIELSEKQRKALKSVQLELLDEFSKYCDENGLRYSLFAGTMLGAIRHRGFIPWDDDIDVCMPRDDYDLFCAKYSGGKDYFLQTVKTDRGYFYHFAKLMKNGTTYNEFATHRLNTKKSIFIDIFPINGYPDPKKRFSSFHYKFWLFVLNKKSYPLKATKLREIKRGAGYRFMTIIAWLLLWWAPYHLCALLRDRFMRLHQFPESPFCISGTNLRRIYERNMFAGKSTVVFEGRSLCAMANPDRYLTKMYGDYMALPPENQRVPHHYLVDFEAPDD